MRRMTNAPIWCRHIPLKFNMQSQCNVMWTAVAPVVPHTLRMVQFSWNTPRCSSLQWKLWQLVWNRRWKISFFVITTGLCHVAGSLSGVFSVLRTRKTGFTVSNYLVRKHYRDPQYKIIWISDRSTRGSWKYLRLHLAIPLRFAFLNSSRDSDDTLKNQPLDTCWDIWNIRSAYDPRPSNLSCHATSTLHLWDVKRNWWYWSRLCHQAGWTMVKQHALYLVGGIPTPLKKYDFVSWDYYVPNWMGK